MFTDLREHEACYITPHGPVDVYSDYPQLAPGPSLSAEEVMAQAEVDLLKMGDLSIVAFYGQRESNARRKLPKFYYSMWNRQRFMSTSYMPSKEEVAIGLDEYLAANGMAPPTPNRKNKNAEKFDEMVGQLIKSAGN